MTQIGLVGLGLVGSALSQRFLAAGHVVLGYDLDEQRRQELALLGGSPTATAHEALSRAEVCLLSLPDTQVVEQVVGAGEQALRGKTVIDTTTGDPDSTRQLGCRLRERGVCYLDATIVGSSQHVRDGEVLLLVGGEAQAFQIWQPLLACFARQVFYLGEVGSGARMKLVVNLVLGLNRAVLAEGLAFARACGVDSGRALDVLRAGLAYSRVMDTKGRKMLDRDFHGVEARLSQHHKDVGLILAMARQLGVELPLSTVHDQLLAAAEDAGYGAADNSAVLVAYDRPAGSRTENPRD